VPNPCQTRDLPMPTRDFSRKTPGFKKKPGFSEPVLNPCQTRDLPVPTREKNMGLGAVRMTKTIVRITGFFRPLDVKIRQLMHLDTSEFREAPTGFQI